MAIGDVDGRPKDEGVFAKQTIANQLGARNEAAKTPPDKRSLANLAKFASPLRTIPMLRLSYATPLVPSLLRCAFSPAQLRTSRTLKLSKWKSVEVS